ncbi:MAG TPA: HAMP domain-containing sensor histidine kinase [Polyangiaceae bacterium]|nr:HAMP domain-containing sensor histidine kinase [Polyangiaceae bacterium]
MSHLGLWPELAVRLFLAGAMVTAVVSALGMWRVRRTDRVQQIALGWSALVFVLLLSRFFALAAASDATTVYMSRLQHTLMLLQVPLVLYLVEGSARGTRHLLLPTLVAVLPFVGGGFATDRVVHHVDAFGARLGYSVPGPFAHLMLPYGVVAGVHVYRKLSTYDGPDASVIRKALIGFLLAVLPAGANDFAMTLGLAKSVLLMDVASCILALGLAYALTRRSNDAYQTLLVAVAEQREALRRGAAEIRTENRVAELGAEVARVLERVREPVRRIASALVVAEDAVLAIPIGGDPRWAEERELLAECRDAAGRVARTVAAFGELVEAGAGKVVPTDVGVLVERALAVVGNEIRHRGRLVKEVQTVPLVDADPEKLVQALVSLLVRAIRSIPVARSAEGRVAVSVSGTRRHVTIRITDNGDPIPASLVPLVFDPYVTTDAEGAGSGLGLALCQRLVTRLGGKVTVESTAAGSEVTVELPVRDPVVSRAPAAA